MNTRHGQRTTLTWAQPAPALLVRNERGENSPKPIARLEPLNHPLTRPSDSLSPNGGEGWGEGAVHGEGRGEGHPTADVLARLQARQRSSPRPSPPSAGSEGEEASATQHLEVAPGARRLGRFRVRMIAGQHDVCAIRMLKRPEGRAPRAFTLVELLVVIAIMGIVAALLVGMAGFSGDKKIRSRVKSELSGLETVIASYHAKNGFYPPSNANDSTLNQLYYELVGATNVPGANPVPYRTLSGEDVPGSVLTALGIGGFMNSADPEAAKNFFFPLKPSQAKPHPASPSVKVLAVPVKGPAGDVVVDRK